MTSPPRCSEASLAVGNDPAGSSSAFRSFLLVTDTGHGASRQRTLPPPGSLIHRRPTHHRVSHLRGHRFAGTLAVMPLRLQLRVSRPRLGHRIAWRAELGPAAPSAVAITREQVDGEVTTVTATVDGRGEQLNMRYAGGERVTETACGGKLFGTGRWLADRE
ncbi:MAG: hypothetical protein M3Y77_07660 [Actinomycetota bacterium]|nr:hypothetical protein [Actinomycetota bacterium]